MRRILFIAFFLMLQASVFCVVSNDQGTTWPLYFRSPRLVPNGSPYYLATSSRLYYTTNGTLVIPATSTTLSHTLTPGTGLNGLPYNGSADRTWAVSTTSTVVTTATAVSQKLTIGTGLTGSPASTYNGSAAITVSLTNPVLTTLGGTGLASWTQGDIPYYNASTLLSKLAKDTNATRYISNQGTSNNPSWNQVNLANGVTGTLPDGNLSSNVALKNIDNSFSTTQSMAGLTINPGGTTPAAGKVWKSRGTGGQGYWGSDSASTTGTLSATAPVTVTAGRAVIGGAATVALTTPLAETYGGTAQTSYAVGDMLYSSVINTLSKLTIGLSGKVLQSNGTIPGWSSFKFPTSVGGTGTVMRSNGTDWLASTFTIPDTTAAGDIIYASAANVYSTLADVAAGAHLRSGGVGVAPLWSTLILPNAATIGDILQATSTNNLAVLNSVATGNALISGGVATANSWGKIGLTTHVSGTLPVANGGTNAGAFTLGSVVFAGASGTYTQDNTNFFWDNTNKRLGVGASPFDAGFAAATRIIAIQTASNQSVSQLVNTNSGAAGHIGQMRFSNLNGGASERAQGNLFVDTPDTDSTTMGFVTMADGAGATAGQFEKTADLNIKAGTSTGVLAHVGGTLNVNTTAVGNVGGGTDDLITYSVPANALATNGDYIEFEMAGTCTNAANTKAIGVVYGASTLFNTGAIGTSVSFEWSIRGRIIRTGATTQKAIVTFISSGAVLAATADYTAPGETLSGAVTLKGTGAGTSDNDIVQQLLTVDWKSIGS